MKELIKGKHLRHVLGMIVIGTLLAGCSAHTALKAEQQTIGQAPAQIAESASVDPGQNVKPDINETSIDTGDLVTVHYTLKLENGEMIFTTDESIAGDGTTPKAEWFQAPASYGPEEVLAGNDNTRHELAENLVGMSDGEEKQVILPPEKGFGPHDSKQVASYSRIKKIPKLARVRAADYVSRFGAFPAVDQEVNFVPYFKSRVVTVDPNSVVMEALAEDGQRIEESFGVTTIRLDGKTVLIDLDPRVGAPFNLKGKWGVISEKDEQSFSVDFNHPAAGQSITMDIKVVAVTKAVEFESDQMVWIEDHDAGFAAAAEAHKPMVMVLYADWCGWCKKLLTQTVTDPRVHDLWDDFVWVKVNSDKQKEYKLLYEQDGFPMVVMTNEKGDVINTVNGFRDARAFRQELEKCLENDKHGNAPV